MSNGYRTLSQHLNDLKKENFSLKLRIYFLEERMQQKYEASREDIYKRVSAGARRGAPPAGGAGAVRLSEVRSRGAGAFQARLLTFTASDLGQARFTLSCGFAASFSAKRGSWAKSEPGTPRAELGRAVGLGAGVGRRVRLAARMRTE